MTHFFRHGSRALRALGLSAAIMTTATTGCGAKPAAAPSAASVLPTCPSQPPSYSQGVASIIQAHCSPCHFSGGTEVGRHDFSTYASVKAQSGDMLNAVYDGLMPPAGSPALSASDSNALLTWLVCNAPNN